MDRDIPPTPEQECPGATPSTEIELGARAYNAVLLDLDGTLLLADGTVSPRASEAIRRVQASGVRVMVVTGRSVHSAASAMADVRLETPLSCYNGGALYCTRKQRLLRQTNLDEELARAVAESLHEAGLDFFLSHEDDEYTLPAKHPEYTPSLGRLMGVKWVDDLSQIPFHSAARISVIGDPDLVREHRELLHQQHHPQIYFENFALNALPSHRDFTVHVLDVHPPSLGKAEALLYLEETCGILRQDVIAVGDGTNDVPMMRAAGRAVAVANAHPSAQAAADEIIGDHDEDAVAIFLERTFLESALPGGAPAAE